MAAGALVGAFVCLMPTSARAWPFPEAHIAGTPFEGPTDPEASALWWNPAALGPMTGVRLTVWSSGRFARTTIARDAICSSTGLPGTCSGAGTRTLAFPAVDLRQDSANGFGALTWNFSETLTLAFGVFAPWVACPPGARCIAQARGGGDNALLPTAYQLDRESFTTLYFTGAAAFRLGRRLYFGVDISVIDSFADLAFFRDATLDGGSAAIGAPCDSATSEPCGYENPRGRSRVRVHGDSGTFFQSRISRGIPSPAGIGTQFGILYRPSELLWIGFSWQRVFSLAGGTHSSGGARGGEVIPSPAAGQPCGDNPCVGGGELRYSLPDVWHLGARLTLRERIEVAAWLRVTTFGGYTRNRPTLLGAVLRFSGDPLRLGGAPSELRLDLGLVPQVTGELGLRWRPRRGLRLGGAVFAGSSAVSAPLVSALALDAPKVGAIAGLEWTATRWLTLSAGYTFTWLFPVQTSGAHDPSATVRCVDSRYDIDVCRATLAGLGLPSNAGRYTQNSHIATLGVSFKLR